MLALWMMFAILTVEQGVNERPGDPGKATVDGIVVNALTGDPLKKVHVVLDGVKNYSTITGADGKFHFESIEPETYEPQAARVGFLDADEEDSFEVEAGQHKKDLVVKMTPEGVISGHVVDEDGDPIAEASVEVERAVQINGQKHWFDADWYRVDSEGYFFFGDLKPGHYYVTATQGAWRRPKNIQISSEHFAPADPPVEIHLAPGAARRDVVLRMKNAIVFRVRGTASVNGTVLTMGGYSTNVAGGKFEFEGVIPGSYTITVPRIRWNPDGIVRPAVYCRVPITVSDHDVEGIAVELGPGPDVEGTIRIDGGGHFANPPVVRIEGIAGWNNNEAKEDGSFGWTNLSPDRHLVMYEPPDGHYVKSMLFNHQPLIDHMIDLSSGGGMLEIVVAPNAASVSATVRDANNVRVALWNDSGYTRILGTEAGDSVDFENLAPGEYRIAAFPKMDPDYAEINEFRGRFNAPKIVLAEGARQNVEIKLIPRATIDAEIAKLQ